MPNKIFFNSSMPRSGSTLLQNILAQNPRFYCSPTSGLASMLTTSRAQYEESPAVRSQDPALMESGFKEFCAAALFGFYRGVTDKPAAIDKSRDWLPLYEWLDWFYPRPKVLICVRDLRAIVSSMEKLYRKSRYRESGRHYHGAGIGLATVANRVGTWMNSDPVGTNALALIDAVQKGLLKRIHVFRFEDLTANPKATMQKIYEYLEEPYFEHDFENVEQVTQEDDAMFGIFGDHTIRKKVEPVPLDYWQVLGKELSARIVQSFGPFYEAFYPGVRP